MLVTKQLMMFIVWNPYSSKYILCSAEIKKFIKFWKNLRVSK